MISSELCFFLIGSFLRQKAKVKVPLEMMFLRAVLQLLVRICKRVHASHLKNGAKT